MPNVACSGIRVTIRNHQQQPRQSTARRSTRRPAFRLMYCACVSLKSQGPSQTAHRDAPHDLERQFRDGQLLSRSTCGRTTRVRCRRPNRVWCSVGVGEVHQGRGDSGYREGEFACAHGVCCESLRVVGGPLRGNERRGLARDAGVLEAQAMTLLRTAAKSANTAAMQRSLAAL
jgi:hypothetical protein